MSSVEFVTIEAADAAVAERFYEAAFGLGARVRVRATDAPTSGFRGFTLSLIVSQPGNVDAIIGEALDAGATSLKAAAKSLWGYGGVVQAPDGTIWTLASSSKKDTGPASTDVDDVVVQLGVAEVGASKQFYVDRGFDVERSFFGRYVEFGPESSPVKLVLYKRPSLAKLAGVDEEGAGSHRLTLGSPAGPFTDPDGFVWEPV